MQSSAQESRVSNRTLASFFFEGRTLASWVVFKSIAIYVCLFSWWLTLPISFSPVAFMENSWELNMCCSHATCSSAMTSMASMSPSNLNLVIHVLCCCLLEQPHVTKLPIGNFQTQTMILKSSNRDPVHVSFRQNLADKDNGRISFAECMLPVSFCLSLGNRDALTNMLPKWQIKRERECMPELKIFALLIVFYSDSE